jgi:hypothetical protein
MIAMFYLHRTVAVENAGEHGNTLLGEGKYIRSMFEPGKHTGAGLTFKHSGSSAPEKLKSRQSSPG